MGRFRWRRATAPGGACPWAERALATIEEVPMAVKDPVCGMTVEEDRAAASSEYPGDH